MKQKLLTSSEAPELEKWQITKTQRTEKQFKILSLTLSSFMLYIFTMCTLQNIKAKLNFHAKIRCVLHLTSSCSSDSKSNNITGWGQIKEDGYK